MRDLSGLLDDYHKNEYHVSNIHERYQFTWRLVTDRRIIRGLSEDYQRVIRIIRVAMVIRVIRLSKLSLPIRPVDIVPVLIPIYIYT